MSFLSNTKKATSKNKSHEWKKNVADDIFHVFSIMYERLLSSTTNLCWYVQFFLTQMEILKCWNRDMLIITQIALFKRREEETMKRLLFAKNYNNNVKIAEKNLMKNACFEGGHEGVSMGHVQEVINSYLVAHFAMRCRTIANREKMFLWT